METYLQVAQHDITVVQRGAGESQLEQLERPRLHRRAEARLAYELAAKHAPAQQDDSLVHGCWVRQYVLVF